MNLKALLCDCINHIHEDIFERNPRGQVKEGQEVTWSRCVWLLNFKDSIKDIAMADNEKLETTQAENDRARIECLEAMLKRMYWYLRGGQTIKPFSEAEHDIGIMIGESRDK